MESNSQNMSENENSSAAEASISDHNCKSCGRALSQTSGKCYYCSEANPEDIKNLSFIMLEWQQKVASDPDLRSTENSKKVLSVIQAFIASACIALGLVPDFIPFRTTYLVYIFAVLSAISCWCFHFNSLTLLFCVITHAATMLFFLQLAFKCIPTLIIPAFVCGFIASLSAFALFLIMVRIFKNKAVEL